MLCVPAGVIYDNEDQSVTSHVWSPAGSMETTALLRWDAAFSNFPLSWFQAAAIVQFTCVSLSDIFMKVIQHYL